MWGCSPSISAPAPAAAAIAVTNKPLYKGYLIKEQIREAFKVKGEEGSR